MTNNINGIGVNTKGLNPYLAPKEKNEGNEKTKTEGQNPKTGGSSLNPDDVLTYMAGSAYVPPAVTAPKTYDVSKYVTPEQAARIAGFIAGFEDEVEKGLKALDKELSGVELPQSVKLEIAAKMAETSV